MYTVQINDKIEIWVSLMLISYSIIIYHVPRYSVFNDIAAINFASDIHDQRFVRDTKNR